GHHRAAHRGARHRPLDRRDAPDLPPRPPGRAAGGRLRRPQGVPSRLPEARHAGAEGGRAAWGSLDAVPHGGGLVPLARRGAGEEINPSQFPAASTILSNRGTFDDLLSDPRGSTDEVVPLPAGSGEILVDCFTAAGERIVVVENEPAPGDEPWFESAQTAANGFVPIAIDVSQRHAETNRVTKGHAVRTLDRDHELALRIQAKGLECR